MGNGYPVLSLNHAAPHFSVYMWGAASPGVVTELLSLSLHLSRLRAGCFLDGIVYDMTRRSHGHEPIPVLPLLRSSLDAILCDFIAAD